MTEISRQESRHLITLDRQMSEDVGDKLVPKRRDWSFRFLLALAAVLLVAALIAGILPLLPTAYLGAGRPFIELPAIGLPFLNIVLPARLAWPLGLRTGHMVMVILLFLAFALLLFARRRAVRNRSMWPSTGCPACYEHELFRVHRGKRDRLISLLGLPVARYQCLDCEWNGRRIHKGPTPIPESHRSSRSLAEDGNGANITVPTLSAAENAYSTRDASPGTAATQRRGDIKAASRCKVIAPLGLNLREEPASDAVLLGTLEPGIIVVSLDSVKGEDGVSWQQIRVKGHKGWVLSAFLEPLK